MPPFGLGRAHIGLDIGTSAVRAAELGGSARNPVVSRFGQVLLPRGAVRNGEVIEVDAVAQAITTLWKRAGFRSRNVRIGIANRRVVVRQIEMPAMSREDLDGAIRFQAQDYIPIPLAEAVMDFEVLEEFLGPDDQPLQRVLVVAAERGMVDPLLGAVQTAKLEPEVLELNAYPLVRALGRDDLVANEAELILDVGAGVTNVVIHQGGRIRFTRILPGLGGDDFTEAVSSSLGLEWEEAESLKHRASSLMAARFGEEETEEATAPLESPVEQDAGEPQGDAPTAEGEEEDEREDPDAGHNPGPEEDEQPEATEPSAPEEEPTEAQAERAVDILTTVLYRFVGEVRGSVDFYTTQSGALPLRTAHLTGGGSLLGGLRDQLGTALRMPVEVGRVFERVPAGKVRLPAEQVELAEPFLAVAVGLALGGLEG